MDIAVKTLVETALLGMKMNVISLVPSWTECLIEAGVNVIGRTRYCIHPAEKVKDIPVVGGTKDINWGMVNALDPEVLLFDKEENPNTFADEAGYPFLATHVVDLKTCAMEMLLLGNTFQNEKLLRFSEELKTELNKDHAFDLNRIPAGIEYLKPPKKHSKLLYLIWKSPWMTVSKETYIGAVLKHLGYETYLFDFSENYPCLELSQYDPEEVFLLFSSEPYPFLKKKRELSELGFAGAFVDGESYSWFGIRSLRFLQSLA